MCVTLPRTAHGAQRARHALRAQLDAWGVAPEDVETAELVLSELVTNSVRHATNPPDRDVQSRASLSGDGVLRLEVSDACRDRPRVPAERPGPDAECGRGLLLVAALAAEWGVSERPYGIGKTVWARLKVGTGT
ncbi:ATP-binding protein [Streptomyces sp. Z26]|uniref:ATP-binding protein n=1 Tax=Streptomyces sp. Z26 TaxID=2500177 RepID=UPI000EF1302A|nr:ATP-binding protein [Streptomyces sp. Z26]RLL69428.1 ATP-binding protein [Streptomyces sp. Z26]